MKMEMRGRLRSFVKNIVEPKLLKTDSRSQLENKRLRTTTSTKQVEKEMPSSKKKRSISLNVFEITTPKPSQKRKSRRNNSEDLSSGKIEVKKQKLNQLTPIESVETSKDFVRRPRSPYKMTASASPTTNKFRAISIFATPVDEVDKIGSRSASTVLDSLLKRSFLTPPRDECNSDAQSTAEVVLGQSTPRTTIFNQGKAVLKKYKRNLLHDLQVITTSTPSTSAALDVELDEHMNLDKSVVERKSKSFHVQFDWASNKNTLHSEKLHANNRREFGALETVELSSTPEAVSSDVRLESVRLANDKVDAPTPSTDPEIIYQTGQMYWAQLYKYCYWPCIVCPGPDRKTFKRKSARNSQSTVLVHVRFFADNGRRNWIKQQNLLQYSSMEHYMDKANEAKQIYGQMSRKYKLFFPKSSEHETWLKAVIEADSMVDVPHENRMEKFQKMCEESLASRKRLRSTVTHEKAAYVDDTELNQSNDDMEKSVVENNAMLTKRLGPGASNAGNARTSKHEELQPESSQNHDDVYLGSSMVANESAEGSLIRVSNRLKSIERKQLKSPIKQEIKVSVKRTPEVRLEKKPTLIPKRPIKEVIDSIFKLDRKYLFKGLKREPVCKYCFEPGGRLVRCSNRCMSWLHAVCIALAQQQRVEINNNVIDADIQLDGNSETKPIASHITAKLDELKVVCRECATKELPKCAVCNQNDTTQKELVSCSVTQCFTHLHPSCCKYWPQAKLTISNNKIESFRCPCHVCHTCVSDDPKGKFQNLSNKMITKCVKCPASYHMDSNCIPAGSQILTAAHIICPRHNVLKADRNVNVSWCFICMRGGEVICCETCPFVVHATCLNISLEPNEGYICEECESGRMPLYGEMVWAKFNLYRWWPAIILPPPEIPENVLRKHHNPSEFVVRFFGTHDHCWISRRRVYLYVEGDSSDRAGSKSLMSQHYAFGVKEATICHEIIQLRKQQEELKGNKAKMHPQPYISIKANRAVPPVKLHTIMDNLPQCGCTPEDANPCGPDSNCINRALYHECNRKVCPAGDRCQNQMFESRISPRFKVVHMKERGFGLVTLDAIKEGGFVIEYVGEIINKKEFKQRMIRRSRDCEKNFYFLSLKTDHIIDAGSKGNLARFLNHSCEPNCEAQKWTVNGLNRIGLFALQDIPGNTELTFNYNWDNMYGSKEMICYCGSIKCSGKLGEKLKNKNFANRK